MGVRLGDRLAPRREDERVGLREAEPERGGGGDEDQAEHRACGSSKWTTQAFNASRGGFTNVGESAYTSEVSRTRGLWRASAMLAHKPRRGAPVDWQKRFRSPTWGDCRPLPPQP